MPARQRRNDGRNSVEFQEAGHNSNSSSSNTKAAAAAAFVAATTTADQTGGGRTNALGTAAGAGANNAISSHDESNNPKLKPKRRGPFERFRRRGHARKRSTSAPPSLDRPYNPLLQDHFRVDAARRVVLPGVPVHDDDFARDAHDFFNLIFLIPVVALNVMNWNWDVLLKDVIFGFNKHHQRHHQHQRLGIPDAWTGDWFDLFFQVTLLYFIVDLIWILVIPSCVKSPATIIQHHLATML
jgi:hypothetical protein